MWLECELKLILRINRDNEIRQVLFSFFQLLMRGEIKIIEIIEETTYYIIVQIHRWRVFLGWRRWILMKLFIDSFESINYSLSIFSNLSFSSSLCSVYFVLSTDIISEIFLLHSRIDNIVYKNDTTRLSFSIYLSFTGMPSLRRADLTTPLRFCFASWKNH